MNKPSTIKFNKNYFFLSIIFFIIELLIALFVNDTFIRPFLGDVLVVLLIYSFLKIFWNVGPLKVAVSVLLFAFSIEILQFFRFVDYLGLQNCKPVAVVLGSTFDWMDMIAYTLGFLVIITVEKIFGRENK